MPKLDIGVADGTQPVPQPAQLVGESAPPALTDERTERAQVAAQASRGDTHLVQPFDVTEARRGVVGDQARQASGERRLHGLRGGVVWRDLNRSDIRRRRGSGTKRTDGFGDRFGEDRSRAPQPVGDGAQRYQVRSPALELQLPETGHPARPVEDGDLVIGQLGERLVIGATQHPPLAAGLERCDRLDWRAAHKGGHQLGSLKGDGIRRALERVLVAL